MKARWKEFKKRHWDSRSARERQTLAFSALLLTPLAVYWLLWQPAHSASEKLRASLPVLRAQAEQMRAQVAEADMLRHRPRPAVLDAGALKLAVEASAARHQMRDALSTLDAQQPGAVRITLASVSFGQWLSWLRDLQQEQHIRAESVAVAALPQTGMVRISATLTNGETP
ncbi:MAG: type II secretion system protein M [Nitrosomonadales bacterium]|nr:type II secretion system protein M [Nitrosomonadales bacterium]